VFLWLSELLRAEFGPLNVFRYVTFRSVGAMTTSLVIALVLYPWFIRRLQVRQIGQVVRTDGPESHFSKRGTPTMGGVLLLVALALSSLLWGDLRNPFVWLTLGVTAAYGALGFLDDFLKIRDRSSRGVRGKPKLLFQFAVAGLVFGLMYAGVMGAALADTTLYVPFFEASSYAMRLPAWAYAVFASVVVVGTSNTVNLADGLDGLAIGPVLTAAATFGLLCYLSGASFGFFEGGQLHRFDVSSYLLIPSVPLAQELAVVAAAIIGAGIGFLWYNAYPALVFMGDVGALALGGALGMLAVLSKNELLTPVVCGVFVAEGLSDIIQTTWFKLTGKRVFRMAPIHHHFEKEGMPEPRVTVRFWIVSVMLALVALASLKLR
jgi:phospho-N-acetylmuramoyl-pentapeptide-transferase